MPLGAGDTLGHNVLKHSVTHPCLDQVPGREVCLGALSSLSWVGQLPPWPGRKVENNEARCSLTWDPENPDPSMLGGLLGSCHLFGFEPHRHVLLPGTVDTFVQSSCGRV